MDIKSKDMKKEEELTKEDMVQTLKMLNVNNERIQDRIVARLNCTGALIAMCAEVIDLLMTDEEELFHILAVKYKHERKYHKNQMMKAARAYHYHMREFTRGYFESEEDKLGQDMEDCSQDFYDIVKLLADHTQSPQDLAQVKASIKRRKLNHHIFEE